VRNHGRQRFADSIDPAATIPLLYTTLSIPCLGIPSHPPHLPVTGSRRAGGRNTSPTVYTVTRLARSSSSPVGVYRGIAPGHPYPTHRLAACPCLASSRNSHRHQLTLLLVPLSLCLSVHFLSLSVAARDPESPGPRPDRAVQQLPLSCPPFCERYQPASPTSNASQLRLGAVVALAPGQAHCYSALVAQPHHPTLRRPSTARPPS
jgi:hypothetical protein